MSGLSQQDLKIFNPQGIMIIMKRYLGFIAVLVAVASMTVSGSGATPRTVFENTTNYLAQYFGTTNEFGDQIKLIDGIERLVLQFKFEYWMAHGVSGNEKMEVNLYANDGLGGQPGTPLYSSGQFSIRSGYNTVTIDGMEINVPDQFTWTVKFTGIETNERFGLLLNDPPTIGSSYNDYWEKVGNTWGTKTLPETVANFSAKVTAQVPEPTVVQYGFLAGLLWMGAILRRRFSSRK
jgi:hypothetical protein